MWKEQTLATKVGSIPTPMPPPPPTPTPQPQYQEAPQPQYTQTAYNPDTNVNDFVNQMTGGIQPTMSQDEFVEDGYVDDDVYVEPTPQVKVITDAKNKGGKRGRPKKK
jgi:hypothetical protein